MKWKPHTEHPDTAPKSCLIAELDEDGGYFLLGDFYTWDGSQFRNQETDKLPRPKIFWWILESDVLEGLPA